MSANDIDFQYHFYYTGSGSSSSPELSLGGGENATRLPEASSTQSIPSQMHCSKARCVHASGVSGAYVYDSKYYNWWQCYFNYTPRRIYGKEDELAVSPWGGTKVYYSFDAGDGDFYGYWTGSTHAPNFRVWIEDTVYFGYGNYTYNFYMDWTNDNTLQQNSIWLDVTDDDVELKRPSYTCIALQNKSGEVVNNEVVSVWGTNSDCDFFLALERGSNQSIPNRFTKPTGLTWDTGSGYFNWGIDEVIYIWLERVPLNTFTQKVEGFNAYCTINFSTKFGEKFESTFNVGIWNDNPQGKFYSLHLGATDSFGETDLVANEVVMRFVDSTSTNQYFVFPFTDDLKNELEQRIAEGGTVIYREVYNDTDYQQYITDQIVMNMDYLTYNSVKGGSKLKLVTSKQVSNTSPTFHQNVTVISGDLTTGGVRRYKVKIDFGYIKPNDTIFIDGSTWTVTVCSIVYELEVNYFLIEVE